MNARPPLDSAASFQGVNDPTSIGKGVDHQVGQASVGTSFILTNARRYLSSAFGLHLHLVGETNRCAVLAQVLRPNYEFRGDDFASVMSPEDHGFRNESGRGSHETPVLVGVLEGAQNGQDGVFREELDASVNVARLSVVRLEEL